MQSNIKPSARKRFVTLFPEATDIHLVKDVGQVPYILAREYGYDSTLVSESDNTFPSLASDTPGLKVVKLAPMGRKVRLPLASFVYIFRQARNIDVLNLYHMRLQTKLAAMLYKARNPQGFVYVKLDMDVFAERAALQAAPARLPLRDKLRDLLHSRFFAAVDLFSAESREGVALAVLRFPAIRAKTIEVTNGLDLASVQASTPLIPFEQKEDLIITVGRLGTYQKNNEVFLDALRNIALGRWKVAFIGPFSAEFESSFNTLLLDRPDLAGAVTLVGNVRDRKQLMQWYNRAKAFVLTSRFEGFPLIFGEAQSYGNYMISTDVSSIREILVDGRYGEVIDAAGGKPLDVLLQNFIDSSMYTKERADELVAYAAKKYEWRTILRAVDEKIRAGHHV